MLDCLIWGLWLSITPLSTSDCTQKVFYQSWQNSRKQSSGSQDPGLLDQNLVEFQLPTRQPLRISSTFGQRQHPILGRRLQHQGVDFPLPVGTPITAVADGQAVEQGHSRRAGKFVTLRHADGWYSRYLHLDNILVHKGGQLAAGEPIGLSGNTGLSTGPHLHLEIGYRGVPLDPMSLLNQRSSPLIKQGSPFYTARSDEQPKVVLISQGGGGTKVTVRLRNKTRTVAPGHRVFGEFQVVRSDNGRYRVIPAV